MHLQDQRAMAKIWIWPMEKVYFICNYINVAKSEKIFSIFECSIDAAQQQMALIFELVVSNQLFSVVLAAYK